MPLFALANAGVPIRFQDGGSPEALAVITGLVLGKPLGIVALSWFAVRAGWLRFPEGVSWRSLIWGGCLAGIGFTMALFNTDLSLEESLLNRAKLGVLAGSSRSVIIGMSCLRFAPTSQIDSETV